LKTAVGDDLTVFYLHVKSSEYSVLLHSDGTEHQSAKCVLTNLKKMWRRHLYRCTLLSWARVQFLSF